MSFVQDRGALGCGKDDVRPHGCGTLVWTGKVNGKLSCFCLINVASPLRGPTDRNRNLAVLHKIKSESFGKWGFWGGSPRRLKLALLETA